MGLRRRMTGHSIAHVLQGRTLQGIADSFTAIAVICDDCSRRTVWTPAEARREPKFQPFMQLDIARLADKMSCKGCGSKNFFLTIASKGV